MKIGGFLGQKNVQGHTLQNVGKALVEQETEVAVINDLCAQMEK